MTTQPRRKRVLIAFLTTVALMLGSIIAAPTAHAAVTYGSVTWNPSSTNNGFTAQNKRTFGPQTQQVVDHTRCYNTVYGQNPLAAWLYTYRSGNYDLQNEGGFFGGHGGLDMEIVTVADWLNDRFSTASGKGAATNRNRLVADELACWNIGPRDFSGYELGEATFTPDTSISSVTTNRRIYNVDDTDSTLYTSCYNITEGPEAKAAMYELVRTGSFTSDMVGYLGAYNSELVSMGKKLHYLLTDGASPVDRNALYAGGIPTC